MSALSGWDRDGGPEPLPAAVRWWYVEQSTGFVFARGGRAPTTRQARRSIRAAGYTAALERQAFLARPNFELVKDGSLRPLIYRKEPA